MLYVIICNEKKCINIDPVKEFILPRRQSCRRLCNTKPLVLLVSGDREMALMTITSASAGLSNWVSSGIICLDITTATVLISIILVTGGGVELQLRWHQSRHNWDNSTTASTLGPTQHNPPPQVAAVTRVGDGLWLWLTGKYYYIQTDHSDLWSEFDFVPAPCKTKREVQK